MSIFDNPDFLSIQPLDFENKLYQPTALLYEYLKQQATTAYQGTRGVVIDVHNAISHEAQLVYEHPVDTFSSWYQLAIEHGTATYQEILPKIGTYYLNVESHLTDLGAQSKAFWTAFHANPEAVAVSLIEPLLKQSGALMTRSQHSANVLAEQIETYLLSVYSNLTQVFDLLLQQPVNTINAVFQNSLAALLDMYAQTISSLLTFV